MIMEVFAVITFSFSEFINCFNYICMLQWWRKPLKVEGPLSSHTQLLTLMTGCSRPARVSGDITMMSLSTNTLSAAGQPRPLAV